MLRRFMSWWRKESRSEHKEGAFEHQESHEGDYIEYKYETTLTRDLRMIADLLGKEPPKNISKDFMYVIDGRRKYHSVNVNNVREIKRAVNLTSFQVDDHLEYIGSLYWSVDSDEYKKVYESKYIRHARVIRELLKLVKENFENHDYYYVFCKYEDSIHIVANTLEEECENSGEISEELFQKSKKIIEKCGQAIMKRFRELEYIEKIQKEAVSKSLVSRLDSEIEFIDKYIEIN